MNVRFTIAGTLTKASTDHLLPAQGTHHTSSVGSHERGGGDSYYIGAHVNDSPSTMCQHPRQYHVTEDTGCSHIDREQLPHSIVREEGKILRVVITNSNIVHCNGRKQTLRLANCKRTV